ncbi:unnamed protein product [Clonostachys rosea f. rosea IK726]|uniref:Sulfotransferase domain-containing protein n=2 Tax=Bionectria ochroleuca TaxID=29856 RepID=A0A0B7JTU8_BIOOC|nr:unnamed protein product [Clonostachys rosea f. rosea IK726]
MASRPIFCATHPRACSTAFERVFMTRRDSLQCVHEPFGDAFYFGPERLSERYTDAAEREASGMANTTYDDVLEDIMVGAQKEGKRVFIKDMAYYLQASDGKPTGIAPSFGGGNEEGNPTNVPIDVLKKFQFTFLIRHPRRSIPSYHRCTLPPLREVTGWDYFSANEAGYVELVRLFDFLLKEGIVDKDNLTVLDADDMLDNPEGSIRAFCEQTNIDFTPEMLKWNDADRDYATVKFAKWNGWHNDALKAYALNKRTHAQKINSVEAENAEWRDKYGADAAKMIRTVVDENIPHYEYLKQFALKI